MNNTYFKPIRAVKKLLHTVMPYLPRFMQKAIAKALQKIQVLRFALKKKGDMPIIAPLKGSMNSALVITSFFNPYNNPILLANFYKFQEKLQQQGVTLCVVELAFGNNDHQISEADYVQVIKVRSNSILWQKEALYNIAIGRFWNLYDALIFLDADVYFTNDNWLEDTLAALNKYKLLQPFSLLVRLPAGSDYMPENKVSYGFLNGQKLPSCTTSTARYSTSCLQFPFIRGSVGIGLAVRSELFSHCELYDALIVGGGDHLNLFAGYGILPYFTNFFTGVHMQHIHNWKQDWGKVVAGSIGSVDQTIYHYAHGTYLGKSKQNRQYILSSNNFDPLKDIIKNADNVWEWTGNNTGLKNDIEQYFLAREQDLQM